MKKNIWKKCSIVLMFASVFCLLAACISVEKGAEKIPEGSVDESMEAGVDESVEKNLDENSEGDSGESTEESFGEKESPEETNSLVYGDYFKEGNAMYRLNIYQEAPQDGGCLCISILQRDPEYSRYSSELHEFHIAYFEGSKVYAEKDEITGQDYQIMFIQDGIVSVSSEKEGVDEGVFYEFETNLIASDAFERPLCRTDLIGLSRQDLRLLRNQFYAVYGRKFQDENLKDYFGSISWYQGTIEPDAFDDGIFGRLEKRNIAFLQEAEDSFDEKQAEEEKQAYEGLAQAPYRYLLPAEGEVAVSLHKDAGNAKDMGIYYEVQGSISLPVVLTQDEYQALHQGEEVKIILDELTGEEAVLCKSKEEQSVYYISQGDYQSEVYFAYDEPLSGYRLWEGSDDTVFEKVYEGSIYVLKGAVDEYVGYFEMSEDEIPKETSEYGEMEFTGDDTEDIYWANHPVWDEKGYLKAMFFFGD